MRNVLAAIIAAAGLGMSGPAMASALYSNFNPLSVGPVDYQTGVSHSFSGFCAAPSCPFINIQTIEFSFVAEASGDAARAYVPFRLLSKVSGAENIYGLTIRDGDSNIVARGGIMESGIAANTLPGTDTVFFDLLPNNSAGQAVGSGVVAVDAPHLVVGETYTAHFEQSFGAMSQNIWYASNEVPAPGQATQLCHPNVPGTCAVFDFGINGYVAVPNVPITNFLPALAITDGSGFEAPVGVPEPASLTLLALGVMGLAGARRRMTGGVGFGA